MNWHNTDVRVLAVALGLCGVFGAVIAPVWVLGGITGVLAAAVVYLNWAAYDGSGNEGSLGVLFLTVGGLVCLLVPMWLAVLVRHLCRG